MEEDFGDVSSFSPPQHFENLLKAIKRKEITKPLVSSLLAREGYEDIQDFFEELEVEDPADQSVYLAFEGMYRIYSTNRLFEAPEGLPFFIGVEVADEQGILFLKDKRLVDYIDFDW